MNRKRLPRRATKLLHAVRWMEILWSCYCEYHNVATYRCRGCGRRPPRELVTSTVERRMAA